MPDTEHQEWLENKKAREAAIKPKSPPVPSKKVGDEKKEEPDDGENRQWAYN